MLSIYRIVMETFVCLYDLYSYAGWRLKKSPVRV